MNKKLRQEVTAALIERDGYRCMFPGCTQPFSKSNPPTIDHWFPFSIYKNEQLENLKLMHFKCNNVKGNIVPNTDGTIDIIQREPKNKSVRPELCNACVSGRILLQGEICSVCGSGPQPPIFNTAMKRKPKNCSHSGQEWCFHCCIGIIKRMDYDGPISY